MQNVASSRDSHHLNENHTDHCQMILFGNQDESKIDLKMSILITEMKRDNITKTV